MGAHRLVRLEGWVPFRGILLQQLPDVLVVEHLSTPGARVDEPYDQRKLQFIVEWDPVQEEPCLAWCVRANTESSPEQKAVAAQAHHRSLLRPTVGPGRRAQLPKRT